MTGLHDERATGEPRRSKRRPERSRREAKVAEPPARRAKREPARVARPPHPLDSEGVTARRDDRSSSPLCGDWGSEEITMAPPPPRRAEAPVPPPERDDSPDSPRTAYVLRNRRVPDTGNQKPTPPPCFEKREIKLDQPRLSKKQLKRAELWNATSCAFKGLERYNDMNQGDEHELVEAVGVKSFCHCGLWLHANFVARRKGASSCDDLVPKYFFAELTIDANGVSCVSCFKMDSVDWKNFGGCGVCPATFVHPAGGGYIGARPERRLELFGQRVGSDPLGSVGMCEERQYMSRNCRHPCLHIFSRSATWPRWMPPPVHSVHGIQRSRVNIREPWVRPHMKINVDRAVGKYSDKGAAVAI